MVFGRSIGGFNRTPFNSDSYGDTFEFTTSGSASSVSSSEQVFTRIIDELNNVRSGFNTQPHNRDDFGSVLYCNVESDTISSGNCAAESIFYVSGIAKSLSSADIIDKIYKIISMVYSGALAVGETVCIDGEKYTVKLDGANAIDKFTGDFPMILPDDNSISYEDSESARTVKVIVSRRDRHI
jgi:hypothetical protein